MSLPTPVRSNIVWCLLLIVSVGMMGCATLIHGSSQEIQVDSTPSGADVEVDGRPVGETPLTAVLERDREYSISMYHEGYEPHHATLRPGRSLWTTVNVFNLFVPGLLVDASTGAFHSLNPGTVTAELVPEDSSAVESPEPDGVQGGSR